MTNYFLSEERRAELKRHLKSLTKEMPDWMAPHFTRLPNDAIDPDESTALEFIQRVISRRMDRVGLHAKVKELRSLTDEERTAYATAMSHVVMAYAEELRDRIFNVGPDGEFVIKPAEEPN
jgi:hypothetical protein